MVSETERSAIVYGKPSRLPFYKTFSIKPLPKDFPIDPSWAWESCASKIITGGVFGAIGGVGLGLFMGAMSSENSVIQVVNGREVPLAPLREQLRSAYKSTAGKTVGWAKSFGVMTALFGGVECIVEKHRAKHDVWNPVISGCVVGATLAAKAGPQASCFGCVGFAGFSFVIDSIMGPH